MREHLDYARLCSYSAAPPRMHLHVQIAGKAEFIAVDTTDPNYDTVFLMHFKASCGLHDWEPVAGIHGKEAEGANRSTPVVLSA